jgi:hypothetical protein
VRFYNNSINLNQEPEEIYNDILNTRKNTNNLWPLFNGGMRKAMTKEKTKGISKTLKAIFGLTDALLFLEANFNCDAGMLNDLKEKASNNTSEEDDLADDNNTSSTTDTSTTSANNNNNGNNNEEEGGNHDLNSEDITQGWSAQCRFDESGIVQA